MNTDSQIEIYRAHDGTTQINVQFDQDTVWLTQAQMSQLFDKNKRTISEYIRNIFKEGELDEKVVVRKSRTVRLQTNQIISGTRSGGRGSNSNWKNSVFLGVRARTKFVVPPNGGLI